MFFYKQIDKGSSSLIEKYIKKKNQTNLEKNLSYLNKISKRSVKYDLIKPALDKSARGAHSSAELMEDSEVNNQSVFTEEDFTNFEKFYFNK
jgi:hypothetical protein